MPNYIAIHCGPYCHMQLTNSYFGTPVNMFIVVCHFSLVFIVLCPAIHKQFNCNLQVSKYARSQKPQWTGRRETWLMLAKTNNASVTTYLLYLKLIKQNKSNWSHFIQTFERSLCKPHASYTIDRFLCHSADGRTEAW